MSSQLHKIRDMIAWREQRIIQNAPNDPRTVTWKEEKQALESALVVMERSGEHGPSSVPQGLWSDHHAAIHSDCEWDWNGAIEAAQEVKRRADSSTL